MKSGNINTARVSARSSDEPHHHLSRGSPCVETIGDGTHQRVVVSVSRFDERVQRKVSAEKRK
jgi:hypothetical protein